MYVQAGYEKDSAVGKYSSLEALLVHHRFFILLLLSDLVILSSSLIALFKIIPLPPFLTTMIVDHNGRHNLSLPSFVECVNVER